jgi:L-histidine N-alpha-methyltransferase
MTAPNLARGAPAALVDDVLRGLTAIPKTLPAKLFYDAAGAELFERICELDEYYLTRAELSILRARAGEIAAIAGEECVLIEYGSGAGIKIRLLLDALVRPAAYVPIDISREQLGRVSASIQREYLRLRVQPLCADYTRPVQIPPLAGDGRRVAFFPGSTIGNFHPAEAAAFLRRIRRTIGYAGALVLGVDRRKEASVLHAAYDDPAGVTAEFNLNVLRRINRELGADFDLRQFRHRAVFDDAASRIEMHLESTRAQTVTIAGRSIAFERGETIWTESSYKYDEARLSALASAAGFRIERLWTDANTQFWVAVLTASESAGTR